MDNDHDREEAEDRGPDLITRVHTLETLVKNQVAMIQAMEGTLTGTLAALAARVAALETEVKALQTKPQEPGLEFKL